MLNICEIKDKTHIIKHSENVLHEALEFVKKGIFSIYIENDLGYDYGLKYINNDDFLHSCKNFPKEIIDFSQPLFPEYFDYDEKNVADLYVEIFEKYSAVFLKDINEYTIAIAKVVLGFTAKKVYVSDERFLWFLKPSKKLVLIKSSEEIKDEHVMTVVQDFVMSALSGNYDIVDSIELFHNVFHRQYFKFLSRLNIRGLVVSIPKTEGIGSILNYTMRMKYICRQYGVEMYVKPNCTRYKDEMLNKYFKLPIKDLNLKKVKNYNLDIKMDLIKNLFEDEKGNYYIDIFPTLVFTNEYYKTHQQFLDDPNNTLTLDVLNDNFIKQLEEYKKAVFKNKRILGVLVRGSDYIVYNMPQQPLPLEQIIPIIKKIKDENGYDKIFLATEDKDYYDGLVKAFPGELIAISQSRISKSELKDCVFISELEKKKAIDIDYNDLLEDNMVNYFYALYLLTKCDGFLASPKCSGVFLVKSFNKEKFDFFKIVEIDNSINA